ncbi:MAG: GNAT family N-acetyltransferase [archaeon]
MKLSFEFVDAQRVEEKEELVEELATTFKESRMIPRRKLDWFKRSIQTDLERGFSYIVARDFKSREAIGMLSLKPYRPKQQELVIFRTNVKEKFWNRGIANALHNHAIGFARRNGTNTVKWSGMLGNMQRVMQHVVDRNTAKLPNSRFVSRTQGELDRSQFPDFFIHLKPVRRRAIRPR